MSAAPAITPLATVAVAFSGGRDSLALLHATVHAAKDLGLQVVALHVHHGLVADADEWVRHAAGLCHRWQRRGLPVRLRWHRVQGRPAAGQSIEAWARHARYAALTAMAKAEGAALVLLGQHRRDQAETVLLQALRGAGPRGLAAMPRQIDRQGLTWARPWLDRPRSAIDAYVHRHRLQPIEDPSNANTTLARNRLRLAVWPALVGAFDDAEVALAAVAQRAQQADAVLREVAELDLAAVNAGGLLQLTPWLTLSSARRANVLRAWLATHWRQGPPDSIVQRLLHELPLATAGRWPAQAGRELVLYRGRLRWAHSHAAAVTGARRHCDLRGARSVHLDDWAGTLTLIRAQNHGLAESDLSRLELRPRTGGERFSLTPKAIPRSLKKQFQTAAVEVDDRRGPLLWRDNALVFVPGLGIDARHWAADGQPQWQLTWIGDSTPPES